MTDQSRPRRIRATVYDVAARAGVSIKTVSRVVNADPAVAESTRARVLDAIAAVRYVPNAAARSLKAGFGDTIGLVIDSIADPWFASLTAVVEERALANGMTVLIGSTGRDPKLLRRQVERLMQQRVRGLILAPMGSEKSYLVETLHDRPLVCVDRRTDAGRFDVVRVPDRAGARSGVEHLIARGHRRIAFFGDGAETSTIALRRRGYTEALRAAGIGIDRALIRPNSSESDTGFTSTLAILDSAPDVTAIFAANPRCGVGVTEALHQVRRTDIAVVSFGDFPLADAVEPAITVLDQDPRPVGATAADLLFERIGGSTVAPRDIRLPIPLIARGSGELTPHRRARSSAAMRSASASGSAVPSA